MSEIFLSKQERRTVIDFLIKKINDREEYEYYQTNPLTGWEQHLETMPCPPWEGVSEADNKWLCEEFEKEYFRKVDVNDWWNIKHITLHQSVALAFGMEPPNIDWEFLNRLNTVPIVSKMKKLSTKLQNTCFYDTERIKFTGFLEWLSNDNMDEIDQKFIGKLIEKNKDFVDWKEEYQKLQVQYNFLYQENVQLKEEMMSSNDKVHGRSQKSFIGMFAGLLAACYSAEEIVEKNVKASEINGDIIEKSGVEITDEVVRKYLDQARPILQQFIDDQEEKKLIKI